MTYDLSFHSFSSSSALSRGNTPITVSLSGISDSFRWALPLTSMITMMFGAFCQIARFFVGRFIGKDVLATAFSVVLYVACGQYY